MSLMQSKYYLVVASTDWKGFRIHSESNSSTKLKRDARKLNKASIRGGKPYRVLRMIAL